ncbi:unnamed protein product [Rotaria magnacalcarata]|uniref:BED-type domain-containing protein n=3 Tax=Rotaria magnacalcarata TaxID=392030 RepID=A0A815KQE0_9BILA|nr:unnamed protein product [Rotaria magnacalcarata]
MGGKGLEKYLENFKEYIAGDSKRKTSATCILCKEIVWHLKNATSNYSRHLQRKHKVEFDSWSKQAYKEKNNKMKQAFIEESLASSSGTEKYGSTHPPQIELAQMVFKNFIIELGLPLSITEKSAFIRAMSTVDPKFRIPCRRSITNEYLPKMYNQILNKLKKTCLAADFISLTFDGWTDRRVRAFYAITMHYVDQTGQLRAHLLAFNHISGSHTGENLFMEYDRVSTSFSIGGKIVRLITDNASNNLSAFGELVIPGHRPNDDDIQNSFDKQEELLRLPCFIHTLQLVVKDGLNDSECIRPPLNLAVLREFISIFTLFAEATTRTQAEQSISISLVGPSILAIYYDLENESRICKHTKPLCHALMTSLLARFGGFLLNLEIPVDDHVKHRNTFNLFSDDIFLVASFLDGQFRLRWIIQSALPLDTKDRLCEKIKNLVALWAFQLIGCNTDNQDGNVTQAEVTTSTVDNVLLCTKDICDGGGLTPKRKSLFSYCEAPQTESKKLRVDAMNEIKEEIMLFLKDPRYETSLIFDKKNHFPYLHRLALRVLCVPATSAPAERIFSKSGLLMTPHRSRLSTDTLSKLTFVKCNVTLIC